MKKLISNLLLLSLLFGANISLAQEDFKETQTGLRYKIMTHDPEAPKVKLGDYITFHMTVSTHKDSVLNSTYQMGSPIKDALVQAAQHNADPSDIFPYLAKGDSVLCLLKSDSLTKYLGRKIPFIPLGTWVKYRFKILEVKSKETLDAEKTAQEKALREEQKAQIEAYIKDDSSLNLEEFKQTESGLYYYIRHKGSGIKVPRRAKVRVHYTGKLLSGKVFDSSREEVAKAEGLYDERRDYSGFSFPLGAGRVIKGWDEGVALLNIGDEAVFLLPSYLAYGERGAGSDIPPNSPLLFEIKVLKLEE